jgi:hypothetical protein
MTASKNAGPPSPRHTVTFFADQGAAAKHQMSCTLAELAHNIQVAAQPNKASLPWLKLAIFGDQRSSKNSFRHNGNVVAISGVEGDYDGGKITFDEAVERIWEARIKAIVYTTPSNTDAKPHWRALCPTSKPLAPGERTRLMDRLNGVVGGGLARESWTLSQAYYFGNIVDRPPVQVEIVDGDFIDQRPDIVAIPKPGGMVEGAEGGTWSQDGNTYTRDGTRFMVEENRVEVTMPGKCYSYYLDTASGLAEARRYMDGQEEKVDQCYAHVCMFRDLGLSQEQSVALAVEYGADEDHARERVAHAWDYARNLPGEKTIAGKFGLHEASPERQAEIIAQCRAEYPDQASPKRKWIFRTPAEDAEGPELTYWDKWRVTKKQGMAPRIIGGCSLVVCGERSSHKTGVVMKECLDAVFNEGAKVLYLALEGAHGIWKARLPAACEKRGKSLDDLTGKWHTFSMSPGLLNEAEIDEMIAECQAEGFLPDIVVIDTMTRAVKGFDINAPATGSGLIDGMERIGKAFDALVIAITHPGKDATKGSIGSSLIESLAFAIWCVRRDGDAVFVEIQKMKDGPQDFTVPFKVVWTDSGVPVITDPAPGESLIKVEQDDAAVSEATVRTALSWRDAYGIAACIFEDRLAEELAGERPAANADVDEHTIWNTRHEKIKVNLRSARSKRKWASLISGERCQPGGNKLLPCWFLPESERPASRASSGAASQNW